MNKRTYAISEAVGCIVIFLLAVFLHFAYELTDHSTLAILFGSVNESVWEHVKIISAGYMGYALFELLWIKVPFHRYVVAKCLGLYLLMGGVIGVYYGYTLFTGHNILWVDIVSSFLLVVSVQFISYRLTVSRLPVEEYFAPSLMLLMLYYLMFFSFTIFPPRAELFRDPESGGFGIIEKYVERGTI